MAKITMEFSGDDLDEDACDEMFDEMFEAHSNCGRWRNGRLVKHCLNAGSEECQFCPYGQKANVLPSVKG